MEYSSMKREDLIKSFNSLEGDIAGTRDLSERMSLISAVVEQSAESIVVTDLEGNYIFFNPSYEKLRGCTRDEVVQKKFKDVYTDEEKKKREYAYEEVMATGYWKGELDFQRKDGSYVPVSCTTVLMKNKAGHPLAIIGLMTDITDLKKAQAELLTAKEEAERANRLKSYFLAAMSHEIRTPINAILGFTNILVNEEADPEKQEKLRLVLQSGKMLLDLLNDILDLAKIESGKYDINPAPVSLSETIRSIKELFDHTARIKGIDFTVSIPESLPEFVICDQKRVRQIIVNILSNAFKFTEKGSVRVTCDYDDGIAKMCVTDTGIGIDKNKQEIIFSEFSQADETISSRYGGTGLGLAICKKLILLMNGAIEVDSKPGRGSAFTVTLPMKLSSGLSAASSSESGADPDDTIRARIASGKGLSILVSEDELISQRFLEVAIKKIGLTCDLASDGKSTLEKMRSKRYDILLLDMQMPVMNGEEVLAALRSEGLIGGPYIIAQTAYAMKEDEDKYISLGCDSYISKPIDIIILKTKIADAILKRG